MSNKLPTAIEYLQEVSPTLLKDLEKYRMRTIVCKDMEFFKDLHCEALKAKYEYNIEALMEENEKLHDKVIDLQALLLGLLDGNLCSAAGDDVIKQALNKEG